MMHQSQKQIAHSYPGCCSCLYTVAEYTRNKDLINNHESVNILAVENRRRLFRAITPHSFQADDRFAKIRLF